MTPWLGKKRLWGPIGSSYVPLNLRDCGGKELETTYSGFWLYLLMPPLAKLEKTARGVVHLVSQRVAHQEGETVAEAFVDFDLGALVVGGA